MLEFIKPHGIEMSLSTLKRGSYRLDLQYILQETIEPSTEHELAGSNCTVRYRKISVETSYDKI